MPTPWFVPIAAVVCAAAIALPANAEMLAIMNYESRVDDSLEALSLQGGAEARREGIAIMEVDPASPDYGRILADIPIPADLVLHHIFYDKTLTKAYVTALGKEVLHVIDLSRWPYRLKPIPTPGCGTQENIILSDDNKTWYLTCMGTANVVVGDAVTDQVIEIIDMPGTFPHGIGLHAGIDRIVVPSCVSPDMGAAGHTLEIIEASTNTHLGAIQVSEKPGAAPVEVVFVPNAEPPIAYVTNIMEDSLWAAVWDPETETFSPRKIFDFGDHDAHWPLEIYFNEAADRAFVTTADPGFLHVLDISEDPLAPVQIAQIPAAGGAHHVAFTPDEKRAYVQNALLNIPGLNHGTITVVDLETFEVIDTITTFRDQGLTANSITLLPRWYRSAGHFNNGPERSH